MQNTGQMGDEMEAATGVSLVADLLMQLVGKLGHGSELGSHVLSAIQTLNKGVPPGSVPPQVKQAFLQKLMMAGRQNQDNVARMRQMAGGNAAAGGQPGMPPPPVPRPPQMPQMMGAGGAMPPAA